MFEIENYSDHENINCPPPFSRHGLRVLSIPLIGHAHCSSLSFSETKPTVTIPFDILHSLTHRPLHSCHSPVCKTVTSVSNKLPALAIRRREVRCRQTFYWSSLRADRECSRPPLNWVRNAQFDARFAYLGNKSKRSSFQLPTSKMSPELRALYIFDLGK